MPGTIIVTDNCLIGEVWNSEVGHWTLYYPGPDGQQAQAAWDNPQGFGMSYDPDTGWLSVGVPDSYGTDATGTWDTGYVFGPMNPNGSLPHRVCIQHNPRLYTCTCTAVVVVTATNRTENGYTLNVSLSGGDCAGSLSDILWAPAPSSGQGSNTAVYTNRSYNQEYTGGVMATDSNGCLAQVNFSFLLKPGPNPPSC